MNKLIKNYIYNVTYQILMIIVPLITAPYLSRVLGPAQLGVYSYVNSITSIIMAVGLIGLNGYGYRQIAYVRDDKEHLSKTFLEIFSLRVILMIVFTIIYIPLIMYSQYRIYFIIQYTLIAIQYIELSWIFIGLEDLRVVIFRNSFAKIFTLVGIFVFIKDENDLWKYFLIISLGKAVTAISAYVFVKRYITWVEFEFKNVFKHILPSLKLLMPQIAALIYLQFDKVMIEWLSTTEQVGFYDQAEKFIQLPLAIITALSSVMLPRLANLFINKQTDKIEYYVKKTITFALFLSLPMVAAFITISETLIPWYLGEEYMYVAYIMIVLSPLTMLNSLIDVSGNQYLTATNQIKVLNISNCLGALVNVVLNLVLIPLYAGIGAAISTVTCLLMVCTIQYSFLNKQIKIFGLHKDLIKYALASLIMGIVVYTLGLLDINILIKIVVQITMGALIYCGVLVVLKDELLHLIFNKIISIFFKRR